jgi:hypothetical protein
VLFDFQHLAWIVAAPLVQRCPLAALPVGSGLTLDLQSDPDPLTIVSRNALIDHVGVPLKSVC